MWISSAPQNKVTHRLSNAGLRCAQNLAVILTITVLLRTLIYSNQLKHSSVEMDIFIEHKQLPVF